MERTVLVVMTFGALMSVVVFAFVAIVSWSDQRRKEREALYRHETMRKLAEQAGAGADRVIEVMREEEAIADAKRREGLKMAGIITLAAGLGFAIFLAVLDPEQEPVWAAGLIPGLVGAAMLAYVYLMAPKPGPRG